MGTAGQLKATKKLIRGYDRDTSFVCLYSDHIYDFSLDEMINADINYDAFIIMGTKQDWSMDLLIFKKKKLQSALHQKEE